jgi:hypothetical protein
MLYLIDPPSIAPPQVLCTYLIFTYYLVNADESSRDKPLSGCIELSSDSSDSSQKSLQTTNTPQPHTTIPPQNEYPHISIQPNKQNITILESNINENSISKEREKERATSRQRIQTKPRANNALLDIQPAKGTVLKKGESTYIVTDATRILVRKADYVLWTPTLAIVEYGEIILKENFVTRKHIYPKNFKSIRLFQSVSHPQLLSEYVTFS